MIKSTLKQVSSHSFIYSISWIATSLASVLLLPIYTHFLSKTDYGILEVLDYTNIIFTIIVVSGLNAAVPRFIDEAQTEEQKKTVVSTASLFVISIGGAVCLFGYSINVTLAQLLLGNASYTYLINLNILLMFAQLFIYIAIPGFIARKKSKSYLAYMLIRLTLTIGLNLFFVAHLRIGVLGMLYGNILANSLVGIAISSHSLLINGIKIRIHVLKKLMKFGLPLIPASLMATVMHNADRFLIRYYCSLDQVGLYGLGYKFPFMLNALILQSFNMIWTGATIYEISRQPDSAYQFGRIATYVLGLYVFMQLSISVFSVSIIRILADPKFYPAHQVIPLVALGLCFHAFFFFFSAGVYIHKKTWVLNLAYFPAAAVNIVGNILFLPKFGYMAAAWITVLTYFVFSTILYIACKSLIKVNYEFKRLATLFILGIITYLIASTYHFENIFTEISKGIVLLTLLSTALFFGGWFTAGEKTFLKNKLFTSCFYILKTGRQVFRHSES